MKSSRRRSGATGSGQELLSCTRLRQRLNGYLEAREAYDHRPLGSRFRETNKQTREGGGLPEGSIIAAGITHRRSCSPPVADLPARKAEREERLLAFNGGDANETLYEISLRGGGKDARFLLAHGADANHYCWEYGVNVSVLLRAARNGHLTVVEALLDAGARRLESALRS